MQIRRALISVHDKTGVVEFARALHSEFGVEIISTGGTAKLLKDNGIPVTLVEEITGFPEMLDGRVKTLHPKIFAGILADRDNPEHMRQLEEMGARPIDMVVVNLYPFEKTVADPHCTFEQAIEMIDIGGVALLRAAAKNHKHVLVVIGHRAYDRILDGLSSGRISLPPSMMAHLARIAHHICARYDMHIAGFHAKRLRRMALEPELEDAFELPALGPERVMRYGENPHQRAVFRGEMTGEPYEKLGGLGDQSTSNSNPSYNNYLDADAALRLCAELSRMDFRSETVWARPLAGQRPADPGPTPSKQVPPITADDRFQKSLPHIQRPGATYFVTFRFLSGSMTEAERDVAMECCLFPHGKKACIHAIVVMPDHVHMLLTPLESSAGDYFALGDILHGVKGVSAQAINKIRERTGAVWQSERFDHIIRNEQGFFDKLNYIASNPSTAGLEVDAPYPWLVVEDHPSWNKEARSGAADPDAILLCSNVREPRKWHRSLDRAKDRPVAGPTKTLLGPADSAADAAKAPTRNCVFIKHNNACGVGIAGDPIEAYRRAYLGDPNAAMGGILAVNFKVEAEFAEGVMDSLARWGKDAGAGAFFLEVWVAPEFNDDAFQIVRTRKPWGEKVRLLAVGDMNVTPDPNALEYRSITGGMLVQTPDLVGLNEDQWKVVTQRAPSESEMADLRLAWLIAKHTKSNAISLVRGGQLIGNGAGQMSRVMSCRIAVWLARENGHLGERDRQQAIGNRQEEMGNRELGPVAASDAFFPFRDGPDILMDAGVTAIIQPGGSKRDAEVIAACDERGAAMIFTGTRHFRH